MKPSHSLLALLSVLFFATARAACGPHHQPEPAASPSATSFQTRLLTNLFNPEPAASPSANTAPHGCEKGPGSSDAGLGESLYAKEQGLRVPKVSPATPDAKKMCANAEYPALCVSTLSPFLVTGRTDAVSALDIAMRTTVQHAKRARAAAARLGAASGPDVDAEALGACGDAYGEALDSLQKARRALAWRDVGTMNSMLSAVVTTSANCEDYFEGDGESPLLAYNSKLQQMASNCLAILEIIEQNRNPKP